MDAVSLLNQHMDVEKLLQHYKFHPHQDGEMIRSNCVIHGGDNPTSFVINRETSLWYCHTGGCGGGDAYTLIQKIEQCSFKEAVHKLATLFNVDIENLEIQERKSDYVKELQQWIHVMKQRTKTKKEVTEYVIQENVREVAKFRTFMEDTLRHFHLGYVDEIALQKKNGEMYTLRKRLVFPIYKEGKQIGVSLRRIQPNDVPKWSHQPVNIETNQILYNYDECLHEKEIVIVEGITDVWAYYEIGISAVCTFGAHLTDEQYRLLMRTGADITLSYDGDEAGQLATKKACELFRNKAKVYVVRLEKGQDPESIERTELKTKYESRERLC